MTLTFLDSGVLIQACRSPDEQQRGVRAILADSTRRFVTSDIQRLELFPKSDYFGKEAELKFYSAYFAQSEQVVLCSPALVQLAEGRARLYGLAAMDALLIAAAIEGGAQEFITSEKPTRPIFKVSELRIISTAT